MNRDPSMPDGSITAWLNQLANPSRVEMAARRLFPRLLQLGEAIANAQHMRPTDAASVVPTEVANLLERVRSGAVAFPNRVALARYLALMLRSRGIDRSRARQYLRSLSGFLEGEASDEFDDAELAAGQDEARFVADCQQLDERLAGGLERTDPRTRRAITLYLQGFSKGEIAAQLRVAPSTVTHVFQEFAALVAQQIGDDL